MEKTADCIVVAFAGEWNDLGSWEALWQAGGKDGNGNVVHGDVFLQDVDNSFVHATGRLVTAVGLSNHVVVETKDAVFVAPRSHVQQVNFVDKILFVGYTLKEEEAPRSEVVLDQMHLGASGEIAVAEEEEASKGKLVVDFYWVCLRLHEFLLALLVNAELVVYPLAFLEVPFLFESDKRVLTS